MNEKCRYSRCSKYFRPEKEHLETRNLDLHQFGFRLLHRFNGTRVINNEIITLTEQMSKVYDLTVYYLSTPVNVRIQIIRNDTLDFPVLTFCSRQPFK